MGTYFVFKWTKLYNILKKAFLLMLYLWQLIQIMVNRDDDQNIIIYKGSSNLLLLKTT